MNARELLEGVSKINPKHTVFDELDLRDKFDGFCDEVRAWDVEDFVELT